MQKLHQCTILKLLNFLLPRPLSEYCSSDITSTNLFTEFLHGQTCLVFKSGTFTLI